MKVTQLNCNVHSHSTDPTVHAQVADLTVPSVITAT